MQEFLKIPKQISYKNTTELKTFALYFALKQFTFNGQLHFFKKNINKYAGALQLSPFKLKTRLQQLLNNDLAKYNGTTLQLIGYKKFNQDHGLYKKSFQKFQLATPDNIENYINACRIKENFKNQEFTKNKKTLINEIEQTDFYLKNKEFLIGDFKRAALMDVKAKQRSAQALKKIAKKLLKNRSDQINADWYKAHYAAWRTAYKLFAPVNPVITLSCAGTARVCAGSKSQATGYRLQQKLKAAGLINVRPGYIEDCNHKCIESGIKAAQWDNLGDLKTTGGIFESLKKVIYKNHRGERFKDYVKLQRRTVCSRIELTF